MIIPSTLWSRSVTDNGYFGRVNPELLKLIPPDAKTVLEIGCGEGALCEAYRRINPGVRWCGIDTFDDGRKRAVAAGVEFVCADIEEDPWHFHCEDNAIHPIFDCIVLGDVLEHLRYPEMALHTIVDGYAKPGAQVLACIPNVGHWTVIAGLLRGEWDYTDEGLLDRTHLRFFTLKSIRAMFKEAGLEIFECRGRRLFNEGFISWSQQTQLGTDDMAVYQWVIRAVKPGSVVPPKLHIHAVEAEDCCARPRIREPFAMLGTIPGVRCTTTGSIPVAADILILQRKQLLINYASIWRDHLLIAEIDDDPTSPVYLDGTTFNPMAFKAVHAVQCSTEAIADIVRQWNPNVMVFPNQIAELPPFAADDSSGGTPNAGIFFGAQNRRADWEPIMPAINKIAKDPGIVVWFDVVHDREFFDALETDAKRFHPFCEYAEYRSILRSCDIALLPLEDNQFNRCKSDLKFLECAAEGVVSLMSLTACKAIDGSCNLGMFYNAPEGGPLTFEYCLRQLLERPDGLKLLAEKHYRYVHDNRLLSQHYRARHDWYLDLVTHRERLTQQLMARCPELKLQPV